MGVPSGETVCEGPSTCLSVSSLDSVPVVSALPPRPPTFCFRCLGNLSPDPLAVRPPKAAGFNRSPAASPSWQYSGRCAITGPGTGRVSLFSNLRISKSLSWQRETPKEQEIEVDGSSCRDGSPHRTQYLCGGDRCGLWTWQTEILGSCKGAPGRTLLAWGAESLSPPSWAHTPRA